MISQKTESLIQNLTNLIYLRNVASQQADYQDPLAKHIENSINAMAEKLEEIIKKDLE